MPNPGIDPIAQPFIDRGDVPPREILRAQRLRSFVGNRRFKNLLDLGCGNGFVTRFFIDCCENICGLDLPEKIEYIQKIIPLGKFAVADFERSIPTPRFLDEKFGVDTFDLILFTDVYLYLPVAIRDDMVKAIHDVLNTEGLLLMSQHTPNQNERSAQRARFETANTIYSQHPYAEPWFWLLREEYFNPSSWWILQAWTKYPPLISINGT